MWNMDSKDRECGNRKKMFWLEAWSSEVLSGLMVVICLPALGQPLPSLSNPIHD